MVSVVVVVTTLDSGEPEEEGESVSGADITMLLLLRRFPLLPRR